jgi:Bacteriophage probable baseplate hub protein
MPNVSMFDASVRARGFYVPQFELRIAGAGLPRAVLRDIIDVTYKDKIDEIDSCELTVNNWDADARAFKYVGSEDLDDKGKPKNPKNPAAANWNIFDPCGKTVELHLGYAGQFERMLVGNFTTLEPNFPASGPPTLQVRVLNRIHKLRSKKYDGHFHDKTDSEIVEEIAKKRDPDLGNVKRFPLPIVTNPNAKKKEPKLFYVAQKNQYDIDFLWSRARMRGYVVVILDQGKEQQLYFGPSRDTEDPTVYELEWGRSLIDFKPTLTTANQYKSVTVRGWDRAAQKPIEEKVDFTDRELAKLNKNLHHLLEQCDPREEFVEEVPVFTKDQAHKLALALLLDQHKRMVRAVGTTVGLPKLRAGSRVKLGKSVGSRLQGIYFVTATTHTFNNNGYVTRFEARREDVRSGAAS